MKIKADLSFRIRIKKRITLTTPILSPTFNFTIRWKE